LPDAAWITVAGTKLPTQDTSVLQMVVTWE
jgi:hypothetical protein